MRESVVISGSTMSGSCTCASTMTTPVSVNSSFERLVDQVQVASSILFSTPCLPRMTIHENVRTTTLVRIGSTTRNSSDALPCAAARAREIHASRIAEQKTHQRRLDAEPQRFDRECAG